MAEIVKKLTEKEREIRELIKAEIPWEPVGPTPMPEIPDLRNWDMRLLKTYAPWYAPFCDLCCLCTYGKCDLTENRRGACGIDIATQQARIVLLACLMGLWGVPLTPLMPGIYWSIRLRNVAPIRR